MRHDCSPECDVSKRSVSRENIAVLRESRATDDDFGIVDLCVMTCLCREIALQSAFAAAPAIS
jgi:hypothetical protein